jgi:hypothetical protein
MAGTIATLSDSRGSAALTGRIARIAAWALLAAAGGYIVYLGLKAGITRTYTINFDADLNYTYRALSLNEGLDPRYLDHTGFTYELVLSWFARLAAMLGAIPAATLSDLRAYNPPAAAIASLVYATRVFSILLSLAFCGVFAWGIWRMSRNALLTASLTLAVAASGGLGYHTLAIRPELLSTLMVFVAFYAVCEAREGTVLRRYVMLGVSVAAAYLAFLTKQQALIPLLFLPVFALFAGTPIHLSERMTGPAGRARAVTVFLLAVIAALPFAVSHYVGVVLVRLTEFPFYAWVLIAYVLGAVVLYGALFGRHWIAALHGVSAALIGAGAGFAVNFFHMSYEIADVNARFLDHMKKFSSMPDADFAGGGGFSALLATTLQQVGVALQSYVLPDNGWRVTLAAASLAGILAGAVLMRRGPRQLGFAVFGLACAGPVCFAVFGLRIQNVFYDPYCLILPLIALAVAWPHLPRRPAVAAGIAAIAVVLAVAQDRQNQAEFIARPVFTEHGNKAFFCEHQKVWGPFLPEEFYTGTRCWDAYALGLPPADRHRFPPPGVPGGKSEI